MKTLYTIAALSVLFITSLSFLDRGAVSYYHPGVDAVERSGGAGDVMGQDRTGSPVAVGTCSACHSGGSFGTTLGIEVLNGDGDEITSYVPGESYTLNVQVNATASAGGFGSQTVALKSDNTQAGIIGAPTSANTQLVTLSGRTYMEHDGMASGGMAYVFTAPWTAPDEGSGDISFYGIGLAANGTGGTSGDLASGTTILSLTEDAVTSISYDGGPSFCSSEGTISPTISGTEGGTFSSSVGLEIDDVTGEIELTTSVPGLYEVLYTYDVDGEATYLMEVNESYSTTGAGELCAGETLTLGAFTLTEDDEGINMLLFEAENSCDSLVEFTLTVLESPEVSVTSSADTICLGETVTFDVSGDEATYTWDEGGITEGEPYAPTSAGFFEYEVTATAVVTGCENTAIASVLVNEVIVSGAVTSEVVGDDGSIVLTVSGGTPAYVFDWDNDGTGDFDDTQDLEDLSEGTYTVVIRDAKDCEATMTYEIDGLSGLDTDALSTLKIYPNPVSEFLNIVHHSAFSYTIVDIDGKEILKGTGNELEEINVVMLPAGTYFVTVNSDKATETLRFVKH